MSAPSGETKRRINALKPLDLREDVLEATRRLGGEAERKDIIREAVLVRGATPEELAVISRVQKASWHFHLPTMADHVITTLHERGELIRLSRGRYRLADGTQDEPELRFGARYRAAGREPRESRGAVDLKRDLDELERRTAEHMHLQDELAEALCALGIEPVSPRSDEPQYDVAFEHNGDVWIAEIKTLADALQSQQLRLGTGQLVEYRHLLSETLGEEVRALLLVDRPPGDDGQRAVLASIEIELLVREDLPQLGALLGRGA